MTEDGGPGTGDRGRKTGRLRRGILAAAAAGAAFGLGTLAFAYLSTHPIRIPLYRRPDGYDHEDIEFLSRDGLKLSGWFLPADNAIATIVFCHGFPFNRSEMLTWVEMVKDLPVNMLLFDFRALGRSEGDLCSIGHHEVQDLLGAVDYLDSRADSRDLPVGVMGLSMGGAVCIMTAAQDCRIQVVATHGSYATLARAIDQRGRFYLGPLGAAISRPAIWWGRKWLPVDPATVSPLAAISRIAPRPVLLMQGARDRVVNPRDGLALYEAAGAPRILHRMPHSWHVKIDKRDIDDYRELLHSFFATYLVSRGS